MKSVPEYLPGFEESPRGDHMLSRAGVTARCYTYQVWDTMGRLCYVGMTHNFQARWKQHKRKSWWLGEIEVSYIELQGWGTTAEARMDEAVVIQGQNPVYNTSTESYWFSRYQQELERSDDFGAPVSRRVFRPLRDLAVV